MEKEGFEKKETKKRGGGGITQRKRAPSYSSCEGRQGCPVTVVLSKYLPVFEWDLKTQGRVVDVTSPPPPLLTGFLSIHPGGTYLGAELRTPMRINSSNKAN